MTAVNEETAVDLEAKLREKEQLVGTLTKRLEQAAEQLDRMRRTGSDRPARGGGVPVEFLEQQAKTLEELNLAVERFEAAEGAEKLARIEMRVTEIRDMLVGGGAKLPPAGAAPPSGSNSPPSNGTTDEANADAQSAWEAMKARIMGDAGGEDVPASAGESNDQPSEASPDEGNGEAAVVAHAPAPVAAPPVEEIDPIDPPAAVDVDAADKNALASAVLERDEYIAHLLNRLRVAESRTMQPVDWEALAESPDELREQLQETQKRLDDATRRAEVELSLERARLSRVEAELEHRGERLEKELLKLGLDDESLDQKQDEAEKGPRWMRILGLGKDDGK